MNLIFDSGIKIYEKRYLKNMLSANFKNSFI